MERVVAVFLASVLAGCAATQKAPPGPGAPTPAAPVSTVSGAEDKCAAGDAAACLAAVKSIEGEAPDEKRFARSAPLKRRACEAKDTKGCHALALALLHGQGMPADRAGALRMFGDDCDRGNGEACNEWGVALFDEAPQRALQLYDRGCVLASPAACHRQGSMLLLGTGGVTVDRERALRLFEKSCDEGEHVGCASLAYNLKVKAGDVTADGRVVSLLARACEGGEPTSCRELGLRHHDGHGLPRDSVTAATLFAKSCERKDASGCDWHGWVTEHGEGTPRDEVTAAKRYAEACDLQWMNGCSNLARMFALGRGVDKDPAHARDLFDRACEGDVETGCQGLSSIDLGERRLAANDRLGAVCDKGVQAACMTLAKKLGRGAGGSDRAAALYEKQCEKGNGDACASGYFLLSPPAFGKTPRKRSARALGLVERACGLGVMCAWLARDLESGVHGRKDAKKARAVATSACERGDAGSCLTLGGFNERAVGGPTDLAGAVRAYDLGCHAETEPEAEACTAFAKLIRAGKGVAKDEERAKAANARAAELDDD